jgi:2-haloacid dehalogenase
MTIRAITFDVYSALFDTLTGLSKAVAALLRQRNAPDDARTLVRTWRQKHLEYLLIANELEHAPVANREAITIAATYALRTLHPHPTPEEVAALVGAWEHLPAWPEAAEVLVAVRMQPLTVAALSNGDEDMLRALLRALPVQFDRIISTEGGRFKPHPSVYVNAMRLLGVRAAELLHVAGSPQDAMGATAAGIRTLWINRTGDAVLDPRFAPAHEGADLHSVLEVLHHHASA